MAGVKNIITGNNAELHFKVYAEGDDASSTYEAVVEVNALGDFSDTANVISVPKFGSAYTRTLVGQKTAGPVDLTLNWVPANSQHQALQAAYKNLTRLSFMLKFVDGVDETYKVFKGQIAGWTTSVSLENVVTVALQVTVDGGFTDSHKA